MTDRPTLTGTFYKTGGYAKGFRQRFYALEWGDHRLQYGKTSALGQSFDLRSVKTASLSLEQKAIYHKKNAVSLTSEKVPAMGVFSVTFKGIFTGRVRKFAISNLDRFQTFAYWLIYSIEKHSRFYFADDAVVGKLELSENNAYLDRAICARTALHFQHIEDVFRLKVAKPEKVSRSRGDEEDIILEGTETLEEEDGEATLIRRGETVGKTRFTQGKFLGRGSFGEVYKGTDVLHRPIVTKQVGLHDDGELEKAKREVQALTIVHDPGKHENLVSLLDVQRPARDKAYFYLDYCGEGAESWLRANLTRGKVKDDVLLANANRFVLGALRGFARIHACKLVHLDQKDDNIRMLGNDVKIIDLGEAIGPALDKSDGPWYSDDVPRGTPTFYAPEQTLESYVYETFTDLVRLDSYKVGLLLLRALSRAFVPDDKWLRVFQGLDRLAPDTGGFKRVEVTFDNVAKAHLLIDDTAAWAKLVDVLMHSKHPLATLCKQLLPLVTIAPAKRWTVTDALQVIE